MNTLIKLGRVIMAKTRMRAWNEVTRDGLDD
jgi:hypothetical protein